MNHNRACELHVGTGFNTKRGFVQSFGSEYQNLVSVADYFRWIPTVPYMFHRAYQLHVGTLVEAFAGFNTKGGFVQWRVKALDPIMIFDEKHNIYVEVAD